MRHYFFFLCLVGALSFHCTGTPVVTSVVDCDPNLTFIKHEVGQARFPPSSQAVSSSVQVTHEAQQLDPNRIQQTTYAECTHLPGVPSNSRITCNIASGSCQATCHANYQFPNGENSMYLTCENGNWRVQGADWTTLPPCKPICQLECQNGGICLSPNKCLCQPDFSGAQCQFEDRQCLTYPKTPMNSRKQCSMRNCTIKCLNGAQFPGGLTEIDFACRNGAWISTNSNFDAQNIPNCDTVCEPTCQNGGRCLSFNRCLCPKEYRGLQCQYRSDRCALRNMPFNGNRECNGTSEYFTCAVSCPQGMSFTFPPADRYTCYYETGVFSPSNVPQCQFGQRYVANNAA
ncbi:neurogenic locus notch homolog protein 3-like [Cloeon dipterum]|uniref:neurogenic locus notch homolog protein 3-like n=1 Tax=Cloeon dipterum TaxID=197152 RepID=UPI00321FDA9E